MMALIDGNPFDVPEGMVQNQLLYLKDSFSQRLKAQGMSLEMLGMNDETFAKSYRDMAVQQVKGELLLDAIASQEGIVAEDEDVDKKIRDYAEQSKTPLEQVQKYFDNDQAKEGLKGQILQEKVSKYLLEQATVTEVEPSPAEMEPAEGNNQEKES